MKELLGNRYRIFEMIGTGGMADVYLGEDTRLGRRVAIKVLRRDLSKDQGFLARFKKEAQAAAALSHPNVVSIYDSGEDSGESFIVMELVEGLTLKEYLEKFTPSLNEKLEIIAQVLEAVKYSHQIGLIHRDIKPGNIMITSDQKVKVMDFGIARLNSANGATLTSTLNIVGTAQYLSPEQATGDLIDERSDIYAIGCIFYELVTDRPPYIGETPVSVAFQHVSNDLIAPSTFVPDINPDLEKVIMISLAKNPDDRYQSAAEMLFDVRKLIRGEKVESVLKRKVNDQKLRQKFIWASLLVLIVGLLGIFGIGKLVNGSGTTITPNFLGETVLQAKSYFGSFTISIKNAPSSSVPFGKILAQDPLPLSHIKRNGKILLTVSTGPGNSTVPLNIVGLNLVDGEAVIHAAGLQVGTITQTTSNSDPGTIISVDPSAGSVVPAGTSVNLQIASGQAVVPGVVGNDIVSATTIEEQAGFVVSEEFQSDANQPINAVLSQSPAAGVTVPLGSVVTLVVNQNGASNNSGSDNSGNNNSGNNNSGSNSSNNNGSNNNNASASGTNNGN